MGCWITELDSEGNVVTTGYGQDAAPLPEFEPGTAMTTAELAALGLTDAALALAEVGEV